MVFSIKVYINMISIIPVVFLLFSFQSRTSTPIIEITSVNPTISTIRNVKCAEFEQWFDDEKKIRTLKGRKEVKSFLNELNNLTKFSGTKTDTDTRAQILIKYPDRTEKICADKFAICRDGTCYTMTEKLREVIW